MFIFAIYGIQTVGGQLARCNDRKYYNDQVGEEVVSGHGFDQVYFRHAVMEHSGENSSYRR